MGQVTVTAPSGVEITAEVEWKHGGKDGIGSYEFHGSKGYDEGSDIWEPDQIELTGIVDSDGNDIDLSTISKDEEESWKDWVAALAEYDGDSLSDQIENSKFDRDRHETT